MLATLLPAAPPPTLRATEGAAAAAKLRWVWGLSSVAVLDNGAVRGVWSAEGWHSVEVLSAQASLAQARAALQAAPAVAVTVNGTFAALLDSADLHTCAGAPLAQRLWSALQEEQRALLDRLRQASAGGQLALVGGAVRDALLGLSAVDLDVVQVGADVQATAKATKLPFVFHPAYGNATLSTPAGPLDVVSARLERYPFPGAAPVARPGTLSQDLLRRDFSLNALALLLASDGALSLHDPAGGLSDLNARVLRPLNAHSLTDDASRLVRAARLGARLELSAHPDLLAQVPQALAVAAQTPRVWAELRLLLAEPRPGQAAQLLGEWGAAALLPAGAAALLGQLDSFSPRPSSATYAAALLHAAEKPQQWAEQLALGPRPAALLQRALSSTYAAPLTPEAALRALLRPEQYVPLTGRDVLALGLNAGPAVGQALSHLSALRASGSVCSRQDEEKELRGYLQQLGPE